MSRLAAGEEAAKRRLADEFGVSRETMAKLERYVEALVIWQSRINLVAPSTLTEIWSRHILDSAQLLRLQPSANHWLDLGSGAGLPGLVLACLGQQHDRLFHMDLVESNAKKASFLRHASSMLDLPADVHAERIEDVVSSLSGIQVVTARALASLDKLIGYAEPALASGAVGLFPKGRGYADELTEAGKNWQIQATLFPSATEEAARIVMIRLAGRRSGGETTSRRVDR